MLWFLGVKLIDKFHGRIYSSRKGLAPWRGQCCWPCAGVPPLRPNGLVMWAAPPTKKSHGRIIEIPHLGHGG